MSNGISLHDVTKIEILPMTMAEGHAWQNVEITMEPQMCCADGEFRQVRQTLRIALHCAGDVQPIEIKSPHFMTTLTK